MSVFFTRRGEVPNIGKIASDYAIGESVFLNINGDATEFLVIHHGLPSNLYDASCNGTWLLMKDCYSEMVFDDDSSNNYATSDIHTYLNYSFLELFDSKIQNIISQVKIPYYNGSSVDSGASGLFTKIFLLGAYELGWTTSNNSYFPIDGACLNYFSETSETDSKRIAHLNGTAVPWWTRSSHLTNSQYIFDVSTSGGLTGDYAHNNDGIRPALILPSDVRI